MIKTGQTITAEDARNLLSLIPIGIFGISDCRSFSTEVIGNYAGSNNTTLGLSQVDYMFQKRTFTTDWASAAESTSIVLLGAYVYLFLRDGSNNYRVYRYDRTNLSSGGTLMTISGQSFSTTGGTDVRMCSDGTAFYFNYKAGNSANDYIISKYTLSGTTLTYSSDITCGASSGVMSSFQVDLSGNIFAEKNSDKTYRKYNSSGTLQTTSSALNDVSASRLSRIGLSFYVNISATLNFLAKVNLV